MHLFAGRHRHEMALAPRRISRTASAASFESRVVMAVFGLLQDGAMCRTKRKLANCVGVRHLRVLGLARMDTQFSGNGSWRAVQRVALACCCSGVRLPALSAA